ncbi:MAG TPA: hypothetical protein VGC32_05720 [Solirubrobacterales bacterium]
MLFWPEFGGAVATAALFGAAYFTRWLPALVFGGLAILSGVASGSEALVVVGSGATGIGVGASVAPALFTTGFTLPSSDLPRVGGVVAISIWVAGHARLQRPDIEPWLEGELPAIDSPPLPGGRR